MIPTPSHRHGVHDQAIARGTLTSRGSSGQDSACSKAERRGRIDTPGVDERLDLLESLPLFVDTEHSASVNRQVIRLARAYRLTSYDAAYLELALRKGLPLATLDKAMRAAADTEGVACLPRDI
jgi:predicted nucleic acid-binding protein